MARNRKAEKAPDCQGSLRSGLAEAGLGGSDGGRIGGGRSCRAVFGCGFGEAEVEDLYGAFGGDFDVRGFQIAMDDAFVVGGFESFGDLAGDGESFVDREWCGERGAFHQFHDDGVAFKSVDGGDVGVIEGGEGLRFALEAGAVVGVGGQSLGENLDSDVAVELGVTGAVDLAHASFAEEVENLVVGQGFAGEQGRR